MEISTVGLDIAKSWFQVHAVDARGAVVLRRKLARSKVTPFFAKLAPCLVGIEACGTAHHWARELIALGHEVKLLPPTYVKAYAKRGKNDAIDAEAICEAVTRPSMRFVPVKSLEQQSVLMLHRVRQQLVRQRTMTANALRSHLAELGIVAAKGRSKLPELFAVVANEADPRVPPLARAALRELVAHWRALKDHLAEVDREIVAWCKGSAATRQLMTIPGVGAITASAIIASVGEATPFRSGRHFAAWLGLTPRQNSTGGKERQAGVSKMGDRYLRTLLVLGATALLRLAKQRAELPLLRWAGKLLASKPPRLVTLALANKLARIVWALLATGASYQPDHRGAAA